MTAEEKRRTQHTFKPQLAKIAMYTCPYIRDYTDWMGIDLATKKGPGWDLDGIEYIRRYENVE